MERPTGEEAGEHVTAPHREIDPAAIAAAYRDACRAELAALKPGNVHAFAPGHGMVVDDFLRSAEASAPAIADPALRVGARVLRAVEATRAAVGMNTNLGILLLAAPLAAAGAAPGPGDLRARLGRVLAGLDRADAEAVFAAIRRAAPGGLGRAEAHDVHEPARVPLGEAMGAAAQRDRVARQYVTDFADVLGLGVPCLRAARARGGEPAWAVTATYLAFLAAFPDSHVARRHGPEAAERVRARAASLDPLDVADPSAHAPCLLALDADLKLEGVNPGTSADLTVATLLAAGLEDAAR